MSSAPASTMPWIELVADISGVCSVAGTFPITSMPTSRASTKIVRSVTRAVDIVLLCRTGRTRRTRRTQQRRDRGADYRTPVTDQNAGLYLVRAIDRELAIGGHVQQQCGDVTRVRV